MLDLIEKLNYYKINISKRTKIARNGQQKYFKLFNEQNVAEYIIQKSIGYNKNYKPAWE